MKVYLSLNRQHRASSTCNEGDPWWELCVSTLAVMEILQHVILPLFVAGVIGFLGLAYWNLRHFLYLSKRLIWIIVVGLFGGLCYCYGGIEAGQKLHTARLLDHHSFQDLLWNKVQLAGIMVVVALVSMMALYFLAKDGYMASRHRTDS